MERVMDKQIDVQTDRCTDRQIYKQTDRLIDGWTDRQTNIDKDGDSLIRGRGAESTNVEN